MSDINALKELAGFVGRSPLSSEDMAIRQTAVNGLIARLEPRPLRRKATDLLGVVLALSARTRRIVQPRVGIEVDCFVPTGQRAVSVYIPKSSSDNHHFDNE